MMRLSIAIVSVFTLLGCESPKPTLKLLMENVPDTAFVQEVIGDFTAETGIPVDIEVRPYAEMHDKLVPELSAPEGKYDVIVVDFYWVGEFTKAGYLQALDDRIAADSFDSSVYFPSLMDLVGKVGGVTYMLPFYNYAMGLTYRKDLVDSSVEQAAFNTQYGIPLRVPQTWDEYLKQVEFFTRPGEELYGVVNQGLTPDPIAMEWSNYLFARGGRFYNDDWTPQLNSAEAALALADYKNLIDNFGPPGAKEFTFGDAFNYAASGKAFSYTTYNFFRSAYDDPAQSQVVGKMEIVSIPGGGLNGAWGWAIPKSTAHSEEAWQLLQWLESPAIAKRRAALGGAPTRRDVFEDAELNAQFAYFPEMRNLVETSHNFPVFTYTVEFVEALATELSAAVNGTKTPEQALSAANAQLTEMLQRDGKL
jgi:multiple sugar transport system substrate-binding protein